jgi:hypothetical protein
LSVFNVLAYPVERWKWVDLINEPDSQPSLSTHQEPMKTFYLEKNPLSTTLQLDLSPSRIKKGGFKIAAFGTCTTSLFKSSITQDICAKRTYHVVERVTVSDSPANGSLVTTCIDVLHDSRKQFQNLAMEVACIVWAQALLDDVYDFITKGIGRLGKPPFQVPPFRFVESALAVEVSPDQKAAVFLVEEVIAEDQQGPFRKYLNNVSPVPLMMSRKEDEDHTSFLAFTQHVQYWKTKKQAFVSDYQGKQFTCLCSHI